MEWVLLIAVSAGDPLMISRFDTEQQCRAFSRQVISVVSMAQQSYEGVRDGTIIPIAASPGPVGKPVVVIRKDCVSLGPKAR